MPGVWAPPAQIVVVGTAMAVGIATGLGAVLFIHLLDIIADATAWVQETVGPVSGLLLAMAAAGLAVGYMVYKWASEAKGHGVPEVMEAIALRGGRIRARVAAVKVVASALTIGAGGSAGREGPIVQVGSALGSTVGRMMHFSEERVRTLVACGAAAGIAATFNAPIAGSIFALEIILGRFTVRYFGAVVISAVSASVVARAFLSNAPAFSVPAYPLNHLAEIPIYIVLGLLSAVVAVAFIRLLYFAEGHFDNWRIPLPFKTALGMVLTGLVALLLPEQNAVLGPGLHFIGEAIADDFNLTYLTMLALLGAKLVATSLTLGSGNSGGVFAPGLFMGATLGGLVGSLGHALWPDIVAHPGAYAIVGMAAVFAGAARAPITAVLIVFEMSGDYKLILPLMMATVLSTLVAESLFKESIYTLKLVLKGVRLISGRVEDVLQNVAVHEVMSADPTTVLDTTPLVVLSRVLNQTHSHGLPVLDEDGRLWGVVTVSDLDRALQEDVPTTAPVSAIATPYERLVTAFPDESIGKALEQMSTRGLGRMPVISREDPRRLVGLIRRADIIEAYTLALNRRAEKLQQSGLDQVAQAQAEMEFIDVTLEPEAPAVGRLIKELATDLPRDCVFVSIRRGTRLFVPHGETQLQAGDKITAFVRPSDEAAVLACLMPADKTA
jgi:CIC family chloride channel protein